MGSSVSLTLITVKKRTSLDSVVREIPWIVTRGEMLEDASDEREAGTKRRKSKVHGPTACCFNAFKIDKH